MKRMTIAIMALVGSALAHAEEQGGRLALPLQQGAGTCATVDSFESSPVMALSSGTPWPGGVVYYNFDAAVTSANRTRIQNAMAVISATLSVTFVVRTAQPGYITIRNSTTVNVNSSSAIGYTGARQFLNIYNWTNQPILIHEIFHALGLRHEQCRADRDAYVSINYPKVDPTYSGNLDIQGGTVSGPYDFLSLMHYSCFSFSLDGDRTIDVKWPYSMYWQYAIGRQTQISAGDAAALRAIYGGTTRPDYFALQSPGHGAFVGTTTPTLIWSPSNGADDYTVEIGTDQFSARIVHTAVVTGTSYAVPAGVLSPNQEYIWRVKARNAKGQTGAMPIPSHVLSTRAGAPAVVYVDPSAPAGGDGSSWNSAYASVHVAENVAFAAAMSDPLGPGVEVRMAGGTYRADDGTNNRYIYVPLDSGLVLRGGYAGRNAPNPDERDTAAHETIITGDILGNDTSDPATRSDNSFWLAMATASPRPPVIDGITFRGAANDNDIGGAVLSDSGGLTVRGCRFESNRAAYYGCGLSAVFGGSIDVKDSVFEGNYAYGAPTIYGLGAVGVAFRSSATFDRSTFVDNSGVSGSAIATLDAGLDVYNSLFVGNAASGVTNGAAVEGGAIAARFSLSSTPPVRIVNSTISGNQAPAGVEAALFCQAGSGSERSVRNSIVWGNTSPTLGANWTVESSLVQGGYAGSGVFDADPGFVNAAAGDYRLAAGSPAVDSGNGAFVLPDFALDLAGELRSQGAAPDLGAYESKPCPGDLNGDGFVDDQDFVEFAEAYDLLDCGDPGMPASCPADLNRDGLVEDADFVLFAAAYDLLLCP